MTKVCATSNGASEAENIEAAAELVASAVIPETSIGICATAGPPGLVDGVLHGSVVQPASIAPVQACLPGVVQLLEGGHHSILVHAGFFTIVEVQVVAAKPWGVREHDPC